MENKEQNGFQFTYSAKDQAEIRKIREKYTTKAREEEDKMERLRRLDAGVTQKAQIISLLFGVIGALILGFGMSLIMSELPEHLGMQRNMAMAVGVLIGVVGGALVGLAYPMYHLIATRERRKIAPEILRLTDELMK